LHRAGKEIRGETDDVRSEWLMKEIKITNRLVVMFADISGSTALYDKLGNELALQQITCTLGILIQEMNAHHGTLIKTIGDEILCTFPDAVTAINAACAMQLAVETQRHCGWLPVFIRIGLHYGDVILESNDIFGDTVNVAARITAITRPRQIMTTQAVVDLLSMDLRKKARPVMNTELRGKKKSIDVFHILWERDNTQFSGIVMSEISMPAGTRNELTLRYQQNVMTVNDKQKVVVLGRGDSCDLVIRNNLASRQHASIEYNHGKFLLSDHSANGTFIRINKNQDILLNHQQVVLHGGGEISFGKPFSESSSEVIEYILQ
jgi:class 3 adenylate cyclase